MADQPDARYGQDLEPLAVIVSEPSCLSRRLGNRTDILHGSEHAHTQNQRQFEAFLSVSDNTWTLSVYSDYLAISS